MLAAAKYARPAFGGGSAKKMDFHVGNLLMVISKCGHGMKSATE
jgi:hypothetical protein